VTQSGVPKTDDFVYGFWLCAKSNQKGRNLRISGLPRHDRLHRLARLGD
jgi:hypothetical protein